MPLLAHMKSTLCCSLSLCCCFLLLLAGRLAVLLLVGRCGGGCVCCCCCLFARWPIAAAEPWQCCGKLCLAEWQLGVVLVGEGDPRRLEGTPLGLCLCGWGGGSGGGTGGGGVRKGRLGTAGVCM
jgi:hypothetical protein